MNRFLAMAALVVLALSAAPAALAGSPDAVRIDVNVVLAGNLSASTTVGGFTLGGSLSGGGSEAGTGWFAGEGHLKTGDPNSLHSDMTLTSADGTITVSLEGLFGTLPAPLAEGSGHWVISDSTGAYSGLHGRGSWTAAADFRAAIAHTGPPRVTFALDGTSNQG
jgi:hypothetical protein